MLQYKPSYLGEHGAALSSFDYHVPLVIIINSAIWEYETQGDNVIKRLKLNFETEKHTGLETVSVTYAIGDNEIKECAVLHNLVPILNLKTIDGEQGFQSERTVVPNRIWDKDKKSWLTQRVEVDNEPQLINKHVGVIFWQSWYVKDESELKSTTKIFTVYSPSTLQTGGDIAKGIAPLEQGNDSRQHLFDLAELALQISLDSKERATNKLRQIQANKSKVQVATADEAKFETPTNENPYDDDGDDEVADSDVDDDATEDFGR